MEDQSFVFWYSESDKHKCGYCKNPTGNLSHGMWAKTLTVEDYQNLIDRGWRRSGNYCYKPVMNEICCPMYTIKCEVENFQLSKSQKRVIKKFNKFLKDGILQANKDQKDEPCGDDGVSDFCYREIPKDVFNVDSEQEPSETIKEALVHTNSEPETSTSQQVNKSESSETKNENPVQLNGPKSGLGADPNRPVCKKAKALRLERKQAKLMKRGMSLEKIDAKSSEKSLEEFLAQDGSLKKHSFKLELINTSSTDSDWDRLKEIEYALYKKYQMIVHNDPPEKCTMSGFVRFLVNSPLKITLERMDEDHKHFKVTADLFAKYQMSVHSESATDCDENQYYNFLVESPLQYVKLSKNSNVAFGSFHQLYWLDDKLIAVGVIDVLPKCVSAVYFFYDPDYRNLSLGTYGSLRELELARKLHGNVDSIRNYYMGFYIHSCQKMRYKGKLKPSYLLCPETYHWVPIEQCLPKLEAAKYSKLVEEDTQTDENGCVGKDIDNMKVLYNRKLMLFKQFKRKYNAESVFSMIGQLVGKKCASSIIFLYRTSDQ